MADYHTYYETPHGEETEWDAIQRKLGNLPPKEGQWKPDPFEPKQEQKKDADLIDEQDEDDLEDLEDDFADDRFLEEYRRKRLAEMKSGTKAPEFGNLVEIRGSDFVNAVTNAGEGIWVVVVLYKPRHERTEILMECLEELANRFTTTKFVKIVSTECIPGYPDFNLPTVLIYHNTNCKQNLVGAKHFGGDRMSVESVAEGLNKYGPICMDKSNASASSASKLRARRGLGALSSDDESDI